MFWTTSFNFHTKLTRKGKSINRSTAVVHKILYPFQSSIKKFCFYFCLKFVCAPNIIIGKHSSWVFIEKSPVHWNKLLFLFMLINRTLKWWRSSRQVFFIDNGIFRHPTCPKSPKFHKFVRNFIFINSWIIEPYYTKEGRTRFYNEIHFRNVCKDKSSKFCCFHIKIVYRPNNQSCALGR